MAVGVAISDGTFNDWPVVLTKSLSNQFSLVLVPFLSI